MKKAFTMIELIFVIVIIGIIAGVAIPKLAANRDDAEIAKQVTNIRTFISDVTAWALSTGKAGYLFASAKTATNALIEESGATCWEVGGCTFKVKIGDVNCLTLRLVKAQVSGDTYKPLRLKFTKDNESNAKCKAFHAQPVIAGYLNTPADGSITEAGEIALSAKLE